MNRTRSLLRISLPPQKIICFLNVYLTLQIFIQENLNLLLLSSYEHPIPKSKKFLLIYITFLFIPSITGETSAEQ